MMQWFRRENDYFTAWMAIALYLVDGVQTGVLGFCKMPSTSLYILIDTMDKNEYKDTLFSIADQLKNTTGKADFCFENPKILMEIHIEILETASKCSCLMAANDLDFDVDYQTYMLQLQCKNNYDQLECSLEILHDRVQSRAEDVESNLSNRFLNAIDELYKIEEDIKQDMRLFFNGVVESISQYNESCLSIMHSLYQACSKSIIKINDFCKSLKCNDEVFAKVVCNYYYDYLEDNKNSILEELYNKLYDNEIITDYSTEPTAADYAKLQQIQKEGLATNRISYIISKEFSLGRPLDISNPVFVKHMKSICMNGNDIQLFCHCFAETAILHSLVKPRIKVLERPIEVKPLPECVNEQIRENDQLNFAFREVMKNLLSFVGRTEAKTKYCHIKRVLEDDGLTSGMNESEFGRLVHNINSEFVATNVTRNLNNNQLVDSRNDLSLPYYEWENNTPTKQQCDKVAKYFEKIKDKLM